MPKNKEQRAVEELIKAFITLLTRGQDAKQRAFLTSFEDKLFNKIDKIFKGDKV